MSTPRQPSEQPSDPPSNGSSKSNMTSKEPVTRPQAAVRRELKNLHSTYRNSANRSNLHSIEVDVDLDRSSRAGRKSISQNPNIYSQRLNRKRKIDTPVGDAVEDDDEPYDTSQVKPLLRTSVSSSSFYGASRKSFFNADIGQNSAIFEPGEDGGGATSSTSQLLGTTDANREEVDISRGFFHVDPTRKQQSISIPEGTPPSESSSSKGKDRQLPILDLPVPPPDSTTSHFTPEITIAANKRSPIKKTATIQKSKRRSELSPSGDGLPLAIPTLTVIPPPEEIEKSGTGSDLSSPLSHVSDSPEGVPRGIEDDADVFAEESKSVSNDAHSEIGTGTSTPKTTAVRGRGRGRGRGRPRGRAGMVRDGATSRANSSSRAGSARLEAGSTRGRKRKRSGTPAVEERRSLPKRSG
ncbi:hypothetical protein BT69DRAFT_1071833 [Atractiella rhizophila]|nr:hypothetical protein BT69DRAFT_1071833 [Atractiella rhizophila]